jgi:hypothetical protein
MSVWLRSVPEAQTLRSFASKREESAGTNGTIDRFTDPRGRGSEPPHPPDPAPRRA